MSWQIALSLNILFSTLRSGIQKKIVGSVDPLVFLFWILCYMLPVVVAMYWLTNGHLPTIYPEILLLGIIFGISTSCLFSAIKISLSQTSVVGTYSIVIPMILAALFLGESSLFAITTIQGQKTIAGLLLAAVSLYYLSKSPDKKSEHITTSWILFILVYIVFDGVGQFWNKLFLQNHEPLEALISQLLGNIPFMYLLIRYKKLPFRVKPAHHAWIALDTIAEVGFAIFLLTAFKLGPLSFVLPIQKLGTIIGGLAIGFLFFDEASTYTKKKLFGLGAGIAGIVLLIL